MRFLLVSALCSQNGKVVRVLGSLSQPNPVIHTLGFGVEFGETLGRLHLPPPPTQALGVVQGAVWDGD